MLFNSHIFIFLFLPLTLFGFYFLGAFGKPKYVVGWLVFASLVFYSWWNPIYVGLILFSTVVNFNLGTWLGKSFGRRSKRRQIVFISGLVFNLGLLAYFKYTNFLLGSLSSVFHTHFPNEAIILPLGISFFTFQKIAYLVDAYEGKAREYDFLNFCLFVTFFPQLIAGPIVHHQEMMPQFKKNKFIFSHEDFSVGITLFALGLFKKVMLADQLAVYATPVFEAARLSHEIGTLAAWIGVLSYSFQIYFDFSGYSDMAIGLGRMFGIKLPLNFNSPYKAVGIIDFWRRWHMTLSRLLRDYLYIPLGGNRHGPVRRYINLMLVMTIGGLWHGANWTFVLWGMCHGFYLLVDHSWRKLIEVNRWTWPAIASFQILARVVTFLSVSVAWVLFRSTDLSTAMRMYEAMFQWMMGPSAEPKYYVGRLMSVFVCGCLVFFLPNTQEIMRGFAPAVNFKKDGVGNQSGRLLHWLEWRPHPVWAVVICLVFLVGVFNMLKVSEFLYFQF